MPVEMQTTWQMLDHNQGIIDNIFSQFKIKQSVYETIKEKVVPQETAGVPRSREAFINMKDIAKINEMNRDL